MGGLVAISIDRPMRLAVRRLLGRPYGNETKDITLHARPPGQSVAPSSAAAPSHRVGQIPGKLSGGPDTSARSARTKRPALAENDNGDPRSESPLVMTG